MRKDKLEAFYRFIDIMQDTRRLMKAGGIPDPSVSRAVTSWCTDKEAWNWIISEMRRMEKKVSTLKNAKEVDDVTEYVHRLVNTAESMKAMVECQKVIADAGDSPTELLKNPIVRSALDWYKQKTGKTHEIESLTDAAIELEESRKTGTSGYNQSNAVYVIGGKSDGQIH